MKDGKDTKSYSSIEYHSMCQASKERIKKLQEEGISTQYDPTDTDEEKKPHVWRITF